MTLGISNRAAGRLVGCSHVAIGAAKRAGRIAVLADGWVLAEAVLDWNVARGAPRGGSHRTVTASRLLPPGSAGKEMNATSFPEAQRRKEYATARLRELQYEREAGATVRVEDAAREHGRQCAIIRTGFLA